MDAKHWFGKSGVGVLLSAQRNIPGGVTPCVRTMAAAYRQLDDIELLLYVLETYRVKLNEHDEELVAKLRVRHEKYKAEA